MSVSVTQFIPPREGQCSGELVAADAGEQQLRSDSLLMSEWLYCVSVNPPYLLVHEVNISKACSVYRKKAQEVP